MDILLTGQETEEHLVVGKSVALVKNTQELKNATSTLVLATTPDRTLLEGPIDGVLFTDTKGKDHIHYRRGILDEVSAKILAKDNKALIIPINTLLNEKNVPRALGRAHQDARLATTHGAPTLFVSMGENYTPTTHDLEATARALGFPEKTVAKNQQAILAWVERARHRASDEYIAEGISKTKGI